MISQASSEESICFVIGREQAHAAHVVLHDEFGRELADELLRITMENDAAIIAVIGDGMKGAPGVSGRVFSALGSHGVNILAIAQGSSERNISTVIKESNRVEAVRAIHKEFIE